MARSKKNTKAEPPGAPVQILLVEDNPGDISLTREAFEATRLANTLHVVRDGVEAMEFLRREGEHREAPRPDLILLDLNLPRKDGREVLAEIKEDSALKTIPVIVLTTSDTQQDVLGAYDLHANCYQIKPVDVEEFFAMVQTIENYWLQMTQLPPPLPADKKPATPSLLTTRG